MSLTFAGFDWVMSLEPNWYSEMLGVRIFASAAVTSFAAIIVTALAAARGPDWRRDQLESTFTTSAS